MGRVGEGGAGWGFKWSVYSGHILSSRRKIEKCLSVVKRVNQVCLCGYNQTKWRAASSWPHLSYPGVPNVLRVEELSAVEHRHICSRRRRNKRKRGREGDSERDPYWTFGCWTWRINEFASRTCVVTLPLVQGQDGPGWGEEGKRTGLEERQPRKTKQRH